MKLNTEVLPLNALAKLEIVRSSRKTDWSESVKELMEDDRDDLILMIHLGTFEKELESLDLQSVFYYIMKNGLEQFEGVRKFEYVNFPRQSSRVHKILMDLETYIETDPILCGVHSLMRLDRSLLNYLIKRSRNIIILNNILIIASFHGDMEIIQLCIQEGADDFITGQKVAALGLHEDIIDFYETVERSSKCEQQVDGYKVYYMAMHHTKLNNPFSRFIAFFRLKALWEDRETSLLSGNNNLSLPITLWSERSVLNQIPFLDCETILRVSRACRPAIQRLQFTPTPENSDSDTSLDLDFNPGFLKQYK